MLRYVTMLAAVVLSLFVILAPSTVAAEEVCLKPNPRTGGCDEWGSDIPSPAEETELTPTTEVNGGVACFFSEITNPQPVAASPFWDGHRDAEGNPVGVSLNCTYDPDNHGLRWRYWALEPPGGFAESADPAELAAQAAEQLDLEAPRIGIAPHPADTGAVGLVGLPVWGWQTNPGVNGPVTAEASEGGDRVEVTAEVAKLVWDWGNGQTTECQAPGTPYEEHFGDEKSPDCGFDGYAKQGNPYTVTLTAIWRIEWDGMGEFGELDARELAATEQIVVGEMQVLRQ